MRKANIIFGVFMVVMVTLIVISIRHIIKLNEAEKKLKAAL